VDLPASSAPPAQRPPKPVYLTLKADGSLALGDNPVSRDALADVLATATSGDKEERIFLRGDRAVPYGEVMELMNDLRRAGYLKVALVGMELREGK
jgi:biopolymer transport protein ExbD